MPDRAIILTIILPFHQEEKNISPTLQRIQECAVVPHELFLIYEKANDPTVAVIKNIQLHYPEMQLFLNGHKPGIPGAIKTGLEKSSGKYVLFLVADDPGPPEIIPRMIELLDQGYDLVSGTRYAKGGRVSGGGLAKPLSRWANRCFSFLTGSTLSDSTTGIKMFKKDILKKIDLQTSTDWAIAFELAIKAQSLGFKLTEIPYPSCNRLRGGKSHFKILPRVLNYSRTFLWGLRQLRK